MARLPLADTASTYGAVSRLNHWIVGAVMLAMLATGLALEYAPLDRSLSGALRDWHRTVGAILLPLAVWRVGWRAAAGFRRAEGSGWQAALARGTHLGLLALVLAMPFSGLAMTLFAGRDLTVLGATIPAAAEIPWAAGLAQAVHGFGGLALAALVAVHVAGAARRLLPQPRLLSQPIR